MRCSFLLPLTAVAACAPAAPSSTSTPIATATTTTTSTAPSAAASAPSRISGTVSNGNGTFTLPDAGGGWHEIVDLMSPPPKQTLPEQEKVVTRIIGDHVNDRAACSDGGWQTVAWIGGAFAGSFTAKGAPEKAYLVDAVPCGGTGEANHFVVMNGDKVVIDGKVPENRFFSVHDLDGDGVNEILLVKEQRSGASAELYSAEDGQLVKFYDFGEITRGNCLTARIFYRMEGTTVDFHADKERMATCR